MNYDLRIKEERKLFIKRANQLLKSERTNVVLCDESNKTVKQNSYIHVLCRILATETGVTEAYAKQVYFKELANPSIFVTVTTDNISGKVIKYYKSIKDLTLQETRKAISSFILWAEENGYHLPKATVQMDGSLSFNSAQDEQAYHQAIIKTSKFENYL